MFQLIPKLRLIDSEKYFQEKIKRIKLRGYSKGSRVSVTSEFKRGIEGRTIPALTVDEIANNFCPPRREIFMRRVLKKKGKKNWGRITGTLVESCICGFKDSIERRSNDINAIRSHKNLVNKSSNFMRWFKGRNRKILSRLAAFQSSPEEDENYLLKTLDYALRHELVMFRSMMLFSDAFTKRLSLQRLELSPQSNILGISSPSRPDFVIPEIAAIGDIKTGKEFKDCFLLTAAGYALAYENQYGAGNDINFGLIYFFPTRLKYISFANVYIFLIDDTLRNYFLTARDEALLMLKNAGDGQLPAFADEEEHCNKCKYKEDCKALREENG